MKKIALIAASLAILVSPAFAEDTKTTGTAPAEAKFSTVSRRLPDVPKSASFASACKRFQLVRKVCGL